MVSWLVCGDFNEILYASEKKGGMLREEGRMKMFHDVLQCCELMDIGFLSPWFTWERGNSMRTNIRERLDRGVANNLWMNLFPEMDLCHLPTLASDHCPLLLDLIGRSRSIRKIIFRFEV